MTTYSFDKSLTVRPLALGTDFQVVGWSAKTYTFAPARDVPVELTGTSAGHKVYSFEITSPLASPVTLPGGIKGSVDPTAVFTDFAHYTAASTVDPVVSLVKSTTSGVAYDAAGTGGFRRVAMTLSLPNDSSTQRRAAFIAPGVRVAGLAQNNGVNIDAAQVEVGSAATTYSPARTLQVGVRPNRLNYAQNPSWRSTSGTTEVRRNLGWHKSTTGFIVSNPTGASWTASVVASGGPEDNGAFFRQTLSGTATAIGGGITFGSTTANTIPVTAGKTYIARALLRCSSAQTLYMLIRYYDASNAQVGTNSQAGGNVAVVANQWTEFTVPAGVAPTGATHAYVTWYQTTGTMWANGDTLDLAGLLIENAGVKLPWFDGSTAATADSLTYSWIGTAGASASAARGATFTSSPFLAYAPIVGWQPSPGIQRLMCTSDVSIWAFGSQNPTSTPPGAYWSMRYKVRQVGGASPVTLLSRLGWYTSVGSNVSVTGGNDPLTSLAPNGGWTEVIVAANQPAPSTAATVRPLIYPYGSTPAGTVLEFKECIFERVGGTGQTAGTYFDGSFGSDYLWEAGTAADVSRSYYYEDYAVRSYLLKQVLAENCPLGVIPAVPQFAVQPRF